MWVAPRAPTERLSRPPAPPQQQRKRTRTSHEHRQSGGQGRSRCLDRNVPCSHYQRIAKRSDGASCMTNVAVKARVGRDEISDEQFNCRARVARRHIARLKSVGRMISAALIGNARKRKTHAAGASDHAGIRNVFDNFNLSRLLPPGRNSTIGTLASPRKISPVPSSNQSVVPAGGAKVMLRSISTGTALAGDGDNATADALTARPIVQRTRVNMRRPTAVRHG